MASVYNSLLGNRQRDNGLPSDDDMVRDTTIEEMSQAVFSASPLRAVRGYIILPTRLNSGSAGERSEPQQSARVQSRQLVIRNSCWKFEVEEVGL
jgi:hypothetical protein